jgi:hypothetical protein
VARHFGNRELPTLDALLPARWTRLGAGSVEGR